MTDLNEKKEQLEKLIVVKKIASDILTAALLDVANQIDFDANKLEAVEREISAENAKKSRGDQVTMGWQVVHMMNWKPLDEFCDLSKETKEKAVAIKNMLDSGMKYVEIGKEMNLSSTYVRSIFEKTQRTHDHFGLTHDAYVLCTNGQHQYHMAPMDLILKLYKDLKNGVWLETRGYAEKKINAVSTELSNYFRKKVVAKRTLMKGERGNAHKMTFWKYEEDKQ